MLEIFLRIYFSSVFFWAFCSICLMVQTKLITSIKLELVLVILVTAFVPIVRKSICNVMQYYNENEQRVEEINKERLKIEEEEKNE